MRRLGRLLFTIAADLENDANRRSEVVLMGGDALDSATEVMLSEQIVDLSGSPILDTR